MKALLEQLEALREALENAPPAATDAEAMVRVQLANHLAAAAQCLNALAADEGPA
jgi:hypothetical protein